MFRVSVAGKLRPLNDALFVESNPIPVKWSLNQMGLMSQRLQKISPTNANRTSARGHRTGGCGMILARLIFLSLIAGLTACGGQSELECEEGGVYLAAEQTPRVAAPDDLDNLDPLREMPLPEASPQQPRPAGSTCLEMPPAIIDGL